MQFYGKQHALTLYEVDSTEQGFGAFIFGGQMDFSVFSTRH